MSLAACWRHFKNNDIVPPVNSAADQDNAQQQQEEAQHQVEHQLEENDDANT